MKEGPYPLDFEEDDQDGPSSSPSFVQALTPCQARPMDRLISTWVEKRDAIDQGLPNPRGESLSKLSIVFTCLSALFVGLRFTTRLLNSNLGVDDGLITAALVRTQIRNQCQSVSDGEETRFLRLV